MKKLGSMDINKIIRAFNAGVPEKDIPMINTKEGKAFYDSLVAEKKKHPDIYFSLVEPDEEEDAFLDSLLP